MSRVTRAEWYERVNATWPEQVPSLTAPEAVRAGRKLYRFAMGRAFKGNVRVTSGNRYTWIRRGEMIVNPERGWHGLVHLLSHYCHDRLHVSAKPHGSGHARLEMRMIKEVQRRGWLSGVLRDREKAPKPEPSEIEKLLARRKRWQTKAKRAATAIKKLDREIRRAERKAAAPPPRSATPIAGEHGRYQVESASAPGESYIVDVLEVEQTNVGAITGTCPCKGWSVRKDCSHLRDARAEHEKQKARQPLD